MRTLFVADKTSDEYRSAEARHPGGAELTDRAAVLACPWPVTLAPLRDVSPGDFERYELVVVGNAATATASQIDALVRHRCTVLFEHDVRICRKRGNFFATRDWPHRFAQRCVCELPDVARLMRAARGTIYLTERQRRAYRANAYYQEGRWAVLGASLFDQGFFDTVARLREQRSPRSGALVLRSANLIKGSAEAKAWAAKHYREVNEVVDLEPNEVLAALARSEAFIYLPRGLEPAGRMPVEARLMGCLVVVNDHLGVGGEPFWLVERRRARAFLRDGPARFWRLIAGMVAAGGGAPAVPRRGYAPVLASGLRRGTRWFARKAAATDRRWLPAPIQFSLETSARRRSQTLRVHAPW